MKNEYAPGWEWLHQLSRTRAQEQETKGIEYWCPGIDQWLSPRQLAYVRDPTPVRVLSGTRRSGKTSAAVVELLNGVPNELYAYIAGNIEKAKALVLPKLYQMKSQWPDFQFELDGRRGLAKVKDGPLIKFFGLATGPDIEILRGDRFCGAIIDEVGTLDADRLQYAVQEVINPALADFAGIGGRGLTLAGTPGRNTWQDLWHELLEGRAWGASVTSLTIADNPFFYGRWEGIVSRELARNGWTWDTPAARREWRGEVVPDTAGLMYGRWDKTIHPMAAAPLSGKTCLGVDPGLKDPTAFVVCRQVGNIVHVLFSEQTPGLSVAEIAQRCRELQNHFQVSEMWIDSFGMGAGYCHTLQANYGIPIYPCKYSATTKAPRVASVDGALGAKTMLIYEDARSLAHELGNLVWDGDMKAARRGSMDHQSDALLVVHDSSFLAYKPVEKSEGDEDPDKLMALGLAPKATRTYLKGRRAKV